MKEALRIAFNTPLYLSRIGRKRYECGLERKDWIKKKTGLLLIMKGIILGDRTSSGSKRTFGSHQILKET